MMIGDHVARDREQPHPETGQPGVKPVCRAPGTQEGLLHDVLSRALVAGRTEREAIELTDMCVVGQQVSLIGSVRALDAVRSSTQPDAAPSPSPPGSPRPVTPLYTAQSRRTFIPARPNLNGSKISKRTLCASGRFSASSPRWGANAGIVRRVVSCAWSARVWPVSLTREIV